MNKDNKKKSIRDVAARKLSYRVRTEDELRKALKGGEFEDREIESVISEFKSLGYLDDVKFSIAYFEYGERKGWAEARIARELKSKGVSEEDIDRALETRKNEDITPFGEEHLGDGERALLVAAKMANPEDLDERGRLTEKIKGRIARRLYGYGYNSDTIFSTIRELETKLKEDY